MTFYSEKRLPTARRFGNGRRAEAETIQLPVIQGRLAQLVEHLVYTERVSGSSPLAPTIVRKAVLIRKALVHYLVMWP